MAKDEHQRPEKESYIKTRLMYASVESWMFAASDACIANAYLVMPCLSHNAKEGRERHLYVDL